MKLNTLLETHSHADIERIRVEIVSILKKRASQEELADALLNYILHQINLSKEE
jgi:hypothetical protein